MALPSSGQISMNQVNVELGNSGTAQISLGSSRVRCLFDVASGPVDMNDGWGKDNTTLSSVTFYDNGEWYVPSGVTSIRVKMWGSGGGGGHTGTGGGGAFAEFTASVSYNQTIRMIIDPEGGSDVDDTEECDPNVGCRNPNNWGGGGYGASIAYMITSTTPYWYFIVGGGGGGSEANGGAAGGSSDSGGTNGSANGSYAGGLAGSTTSGTYHIDHNPASVTVPTYTQTFCEFSDCGTLTGRWGGGGGGGWRNGAAGSGNWTSGWGNGGGGGGGWSGYSDPGPHLSNITSQGGSGTSPGGTSDPYYNNNYGPGGAAFSSGKPGKIVIIYASGQKCP